jgi:CRP/FNR family transcriptional regulator, cyclic AMP receptor protein
MIGVPITELVRLLDADPDLGDGLDNDRRAIARRLLVAEVVALRPKQPLCDAVLREDTGSVLGLLVLDGLVLRHVEIVGESGVELLGAGDVIRPWQVDADFASLPAEARWTVCEPSRFAVIADEVQTLLARFPAVFRNLVRRLEQRANTLALQLALAQVPRLEARLLALLWQLADRFGRVETTGVVVPIRLSQSTLAQLVFARRPSVTTALGRLADRGLLTRHGDGRITLHGDPPSVAYERSPSTTARFTRQPVL